MTNEEIKNLKALVVDDDVFMRDLISTTLTTIGVGEVKTAGGGQYALGLLNSNEADFNLLMCDLYMPDMDGIEFLDHVKRCGFDGHIILFSGVNRKMLEQARKLVTARQIEVLGCLEKPITQENLKELLSQGDFKKAE